LFLLPSIELRVPIHLKMNVSDSHPGAMNHWSAASHQVHVDKPVTEVESDGDQVLQSLDYVPKLQRNRSTPQAAFMAFFLASIPYRLSTTLSNPITTGGPVNIIWGWLAVSALIVCVASSLGEITSVYPVAGVKQFFKQMLLRCVAQSYC
jgi:amino acid permease